MDISKRQTGVVVQLKSGGPKMTVTGERSPLHGDHVQCQWFAGSKLESGFFPAASLIIPSESEGKKK